MASDRDLAKAGIMTGLIAFLLGRSNNNQEIILPNLNPIVPPNDQKVLFRVDLQSFAFPIAAGPTSTAPDHSRQNFVPIGNYVNIGAEVTDQPISKIGLRGFFADPTAASGAMTDFFHFMTSYQAGPIGDYATKPIVVVPGAEVDLEPTTPATPQFFDSGLVSYGLIIPQSRVTVACTYRSAGGFTMSGYLEVYYVN